MTRLRPALVLAGATAAVIVALPSAAHAASDPISINLGSGWVHDSSAPLFNDTRIAPGWTGTKTLEVRNNTNASMTLGISSADIVDSENGCMHSEALVDTTCGNGPDQGELGHEMVFSVYLDPTDTGTYTGPPAWTGTLYDIQAAAVLSSSVPANGVWGVRVTAELPYSSGNETQTDSVGYSLRLDGDGTGAGLTTSVLGETFTKAGGDPAGSSGIHVASVLGETFGAGSLPFTGSYADVLLPVGITLVLGGGLLRLSAIRRRARSSD